MEQSEKDENTTSTVVHFIEAGLIGSKFGEFEFRICFGFGASNFGFQRPVGGIYIVISAPDDCHFARFQKVAKPLGPWFTTHRDWQAAMGPPGARHPRVFAFAQDGGLGIQGNLCQFGFFVFLLIIFRHLPLSSKGLLLMIIPSRPCFFNVRPKGSGIKPDPTCRVAFHMPPIVLMKHPPPPPPPAPPADVVLTVLAPASTTSSVLGALS
jgi:hypothetical protein